MSSPAAAVLGPATRLPLRVGVGVGIAAGCVLALQVLLTRIFSAALFYHFSFLTISLALLGAGAGSIAVYVRPRWFAGDLERRLTQWGAAFAVLLAVVPLALVRVRFGTGEQLTTPFILRLVLVSVLTTVVFAAGGLVVALAVRGYTAQIGRLYAMDLVGAAAGAVVVVPLLWTVAAPVLLVGLAPVAALAALLFAGRSGLAAALRGPAGAALGVGVLAVAAAAATDAYRLAPTTVAAGDAVPLSDKWNPLSRVVGYAPPPGGGFALVFYDRVYAPAPVVPQGGPIPGWKPLHLGPQSLAYVLGGRDRALVIGGGGGRDILNALTSGVRRVDVVELNRGIRDVVDGPLKRFTQAPYAMPRVHTTIGDGRSTLARDHSRYDVVHLGFTDTLSANSAQAFALTENNLYTVQAVDEYLDHLRPDGVLAISRLYRLVGDEALRATVLALDALRRRGVSDPAAHVVVLQGRDILGERFGTVLVRRRPWTPAEVARVRRLAPERDGSVAFAPGGPYADEWAQLHAAPSAEAFCASYRLDVCAPTDDKPFFFQMRRLGSLRAHGGGLRLHGRPVRRAARDVRDPRRPVGGARRRAARPDLAARPAAAGRPRALRRHRARVPDARGGADPAVRALPRVPDLCALGRAVLAPGLDGCGLAAQQPRGRPPAGARPSRWGPRARSSPRRRTGCSRSWARSSS